MAVFIYTKLNRVLAFPGAVGLTKENSLCDFLFGSVDDKPFPKTRKLFQQQSKETVCSFRIL